MLYEQVVNTVIVLAGIFLSMSISSSPKTRDAYVKRVTFPQSLLFLRVLHSSGNVMDRYISRTPTNLCHLHCIICLGFLLSPDW